MPPDAQGDATLEKLDAAVKKVQTGPLAERFAKVSILRKDPGPYMVESVNPGDRHVFSAQKRYRGLMALLRNSLFLTTIGPATSWVLWVDSDIVETPPTLIQDMTLHDKPILVANCFQHYSDPQKGPAVKPSDFSSWQESDKTLQMAQQMDDDDIIVENFPELKTDRAHLASMYDPAGDMHTEVSLDGVAATVLLVKAEVHRDGAMFPHFPFYHLLESEGFAKMAQRLGYQCYGLPNYLVFHAEGT